MTFIYVWCIYSDLYQICIITAEVVIASPLADMLRHCTRTARKCLCDSCDCEEFCFYERNVLYTVLYKL